MATGEGDSASGDADRPPHLGDALPLPEQLVAKPIVDPGPSPGPAATSKNPPLTPAELAEANAARAATADANNQKALIAASMLAVVLAAVIVFFLIRGVSGGPGNDDSIAKEVVDNVATTPVAAEVGLAPLPTLIPTPTAMRIDPAALTDDPVAFGSATGVATGIGSDETVWNITVSGLRDVSDDVLAHDSSNEPPGPGLLFAGFDVTAQLALADSSRARPAASFRVFVVGGDTSTTYHASPLACGLVPDAFNSGLEVFEGGVVQGLMCAPMLPGDIAHPDTAVIVAGFGAGDELVFRADGSEGNPSKVQADGLGLGVGAITLRTDAEFSVRSERTRFDGVQVESAWNVSVSSLRDITEEVQAAAPFGADLPDDLAFVGFELEMTLASSSVPLLSPSTAFDIEVFGGSTLTTSNQLAFPQYLGCTQYVGFPRFAWVMSSATLSGSYCMVLPRDDLAHPDTMVALTSGLGTTTFRSDGGQGSAPTTTEGADVADLGPAEAFGFPFEVSLLAPIPGEIGWLVEVNNWQQFPDVSGPGRVTFDLNLEVLAAPHGTTSPSFGFEIGVFGGVSRRVFTDFDRAELGSCDRTPDAFNFFQSLNVGQSAFGEVCLFVPSEDIGHPETRVVVLGPQGPALVLDPDPGS